MIQIRDNELTAMLVQILEAYFGAGEEHSSKILIVNFFSPWVSLLREGIDEGNKTK